MTAISDDARRRCRRRRSRRTSAASQRRPPSPRALLVPALACAFLRAALLPSSLGRSLRMSNLSYQLFADSRLFADAREIVATREWQLLGENDTIPAGLHVRMDLSTGEKWAKIPEDEERDEDKAAAHPGDDYGEGVERVEAVEMDAGGALTIVESDRNADGDGGAEEANRGGKSKLSDAAPDRDYEMMHRVMSRLPPEELERFGGLPALPAASNETKRSSLTEAQRTLFEARMEEIWRTRQEELARAQESLADLPAMLTERIATLGEYLDDPERGLRELAEKRRRRKESGATEGDEDEGDAVADDVLSALRDLEFQLSDVDMARDFHALGGWPRLVALLDEKAHPTADEDEDASTAVDEIRALAAMTIGTAVGNVGEFRGWALEDWSGSIDAPTDSDVRSEATAPVSALSALVSSFERELSDRTRRMNGGTVAAESRSDARYVSRATYKLRATYALGSLLRGNPAAQRGFVRMGGPDLLVRDALGSISSVRGPSAETGKRAKVDWRYASKVLAMAEDVATDVALHPDDYRYVPQEGEAELAAGHLVAAFATERWCDLSLRMLSPAEAVGDMARRGIQERAMASVRALGPGCTELSRRRASEEEDGGSGEEGESWGTEEVRRVRSEWNREGSDDGLDPTYRRELLELADGVLEVLR
ncbi:hypothetical protein ACHAWF_009651 [Thalassiosira exigua]